MTSQTSKTNETCATANIRAAGSAETESGRQFCSFQRLGYQLTTDVHQVQSLSACLPSRLDAAHISDYVIY